MRTEIVIIGAGPAGCTAAVQCKRLGVALVLLDETGVAGGLVAQGHMVENYPGLERPIPGPVMARRLAEHLDRFEVSVTRSKVERVRPGDGDFWSVETNAGEVVADCVILAIGTVPKSAGVAGGMGCKRLFYGVGELLAAVPAPRDVIVVGGGEAAYDYALSSASAGAQVSIFVRGSKERAGGRLARQVDRNEKISVERNARVLSLTESGEKVIAAVQVGETEDTRPVDAVIEAVGRVSRVESILGDLAGTVQPFALTPIDGLFICGDARSGSLGQMGIAVGDGLTAAAMAVDRIARKTDN